MNPPAASSNSPGVSHSVSDPGQSRAVLKTLDLLLRNVADLVAGLDDATYRDQRNPTFRSSPGGHIRHLLDHVRALIAGLDSTDGLICYDRRRRGTDVENNRDACLTAIGGLRGRLSHWLAAAGEAGEAAAQAAVLPAPQGRIFDPARSVRVEQIVDPGREPILLESNALRELVFVFHHSIHHAALLAARMRSAGFEVPEQFGIAPATLAANR
jgi:hypothetical protein